MSKFKNFLSSNLYSHLRRDSETPFVDNHGRFHVRKKSLPAHFVYRIIDIQSKKNKTFDSDGLVDLNRFNLVAAENVQGKNNIAILKNVKSDRLKYFVCDRNWKVKSKYPATSDALSDISPSFGADLTNSRLKISGLNNKGLTSLQPISDASGDGTPYSMFIDGTLFIEGLSELSHNSETFYVWAQSDRKSDTPIDLGPITTDPKYSDYYFQIAENKLPENYGPPYPNIYSFRVVDSKGKTVLENKNSDGTPFYFDIFNKRYAADNDTKKDTGDVRSNRLVWTTDEQKQKDFDLQHSTMQFAIGKGGTDILDLSNTDRDGAYFINGNSVNLRRKILDTSDLAYYGGTAFDVLTIVSKTSKAVHEVYMQGIEQIHFPYVSQRPLYLNSSQGYENQSQWNLQAMDVPNAWRFGKGSSDVILVSLDNGLPLPDDRDSDIERAISKDNIESLSNHGEEASIVMGGSTMGIAPEAPLFSYNVYADPQGHPGTDLDVAINNTLKWANSKRIVFQTGIQGETRLTANVQQALNKSTDLGNSFFSVAAGNCGDSGVPIPECYESTSGVAKAALSNKNVASAGGLDPYDETLSSLGFDPIIGPVNVNSASLTMDDNSHRGESDKSLTFALPWLNPDQDHDSYKLFNGTSNANPNLAGLAALVWAQYPDFTGSELRDVLAHSAMHFTENNGGFSNTFGWGLPNADSAVRRGYALAKNPRYAQMWSNSDFFV